MKEHEDKIEEADKNAIEEKAEALEKAVAESNVESMTSLKEELKTLLSSIGEKLYTAAAAESAQANPQGPPSEGDSQESDDQVVDADYEVKD